MLSIRRILVLIVIILLMVPFALWDSTSVSQDDPCTNQAPKIQQPEIIKNPSIDMNKNLRFLIVGRNNLIMENITSLFNEQKLSFSVTEFANWRDIKDMDMVIICDNDISNLASLANIAAYISAGGSVLFAGGLTEYYTDTYLNPILGIENKALQIETGDLTVADDFFVIDEENMKYADFNGSVWLSLRSTTTTYISESESGLPIVFSHPYEEGNALVVNGTFLDNPDNMGIVSALMCKGLDAFAYPIIGKSLTYLDSISDIAYDDKLTMAEYGLNSNHLILDKLMPELIALSLKHNIPYTASLQIVSSTPASVLPRELSTTWNIAKQFINYGGEITYSGNFERDDYSTNNKIIEDFNSVFPNYTPNAFMINSGKYTQDVDDYVMADFPNTAILRYSPSPESLKSDSSIPAISYGVDFEDGENFKIINNLTSKGLFSHRMDMRQLAGFADDGKSFRDIMENLTSLSSLYKKMTWLEPVTISQAIPYINSYNSLSFTQQKTPNGYEICVDDFITSQSFMFYSEKKIHQIEGGSIQAINGNYYVIKCNDSNLSISWEEK